MSIYYNRDLCPRLVVENAHLWLAEFAPLSCSRTIFVSDRSYIGRRGEPVQLNITTIKNLKSVTKGYLT